MVSSKKTGAKISPLLQARFLSVLAWLSYWLGNIQTAQTSLHESQELCAKNPGSISDLIAADNLYLDGTLALGRGDLSRAKTLAEKGLALYQALDNKFGVAEMSGLLFGIALISGDLETANHWNEAAVTIRKQIRDKDGLAYDLTIGAVIPFCLRDYESTKRRLTIAIEAGKEAPNKFTLGLALSFFGVSCLFDNNMGQALNCFSQFATLASEKSHTPLKTLSLYYLALFLFKQKQYRTSTKLIGALEGLKTYNIVLLYDIPIIHAAREQYLLEARETLGETDFNAAYAEGRAMTLDQATVYSLKALGQ